MHQVDASRIRLVTARFQELQGLRHIAVFAAVLAAFWGKPYFRLLREAGRIPAFVGFVGFALPLLAALAARPWFDRYYVRRFGRVAASPVTWRTFGEGLAFLTAIALDLLMPPASRPSAVLLAAAALSSAIVVRDWPWRAHHLIPAIVCGVAAYLGATTPAAADIEAASVLRTSLTIVLLSNVPAAWLDHRLLVAALPGHSESSEATADIEG